MTSSEVVKAVFKDELEAFELSRSGVYNMTLEVLMNVPDYFFKPNEDGSENELITRTKRAFSLANKLLSLKCYQESFDEMDRDNIRSAILLHDGFAYGVSPSGKEPVLDHPALMADLLRKEKWDAFFPRTFREYVIGAVEAHSQQWNETRKARGGSKEPQGAVEGFVYSCIYAAGGEGDVSFGMGMDGIYKGRESVPADVNAPISFETARDLMRQIVSGHNWDGNVYEDVNGPHLILEGVRIQIPDQVANACAAAGISLFSEEDQEEDQENIWNDPFLESLSQEEDREDEEEDFPYGDPASYEDPPVYEDSSFAEDLSGEPADVVDLSLEDDLYDEGFPDDGLFSSEDFSFEDVQNSCEEFADEEEAFLARVEEAIANDAFHEEWNVPGTVWNSFESQTPDSKEEGSENSAPSAYDEESWEMYLS